MSTKPAQKKGFTLVELLVVITIIAILSVIGITIFTGVQKSARVGKAVADLRTLSQTYERYYIENGKPPPFDHDWAAGGESCSLVSGNFAPKPATWNGPYYQSFPANSWGAQYHFEHDSIYPYSISVHLVPQSEALALDKAIDDGNLTTGNFREAIVNERYEYRIGVGWDAYHEHFTSCTP